MQVIDYFKQLCAIPHASFDEGRIGDFLIDFAEKRELEHYRDEAGNVVIKKPASDPACKAPAVIIQGHMDMVYVRTGDCKRAYEDGIKTLEQDGFITADGTSLGADDGLALAYALAVLDSEDMAHPPIEAVFTVQEEVGLLGAAALDCSMLRGKYLINIDTELEGIFYTSCAGAVRNDLIFPLRREKTEGLTQLKIGIGGLKGGHSGMEIHLGRPNAIVLMARALLTLGGTIKIHSIRCDGKTNAIATDCEAEIYAQPDKLPQIEKLLKKQEAVFNDSFSGIDNIKISLTQGNTENAECWDKATHQAVMSAMNMLPNGVISMSETTPGLVETSSNPGIVTCTDKQLVISSCVRSSVPGSKEFVLKRLDEVANFSSGDSVNHGDYPLWQYDPESKLRPLAMECYKELFGKDATAEAIHAGLECGYFAEKVPGLDIVSFGPDQLEVHTTRERADLASIERIWQLLKLMLEKLSK